MKPAMTPSAMPVPKVRCVWPLDAELGEGPVWSESEQRLRFVDIEAGRVHNYDPSTGQGCTIETGGRPSFIVPEAGGNWLVGSRHGLHQLTREGLGELLVRIEQPGHNRTNDATVDASGRLWFGTMDDRERRPTGTVWCLDRGTLHATGTSAVVTNGPACCALLDVLYHVDSPNRRIWRCPLDRGTSLAKSEPFLELSEEDGYPDGIVVDAEGCLWVALWDGWGVRRYSPAGDLLLHVPLPCARVTKVALGGPNLSTAFVTTARVGLTRDDLARQPLAGALFAFEAGARGLPLPAYRSA